VRGVEDDSSHRITVREKAVTVKRVTTDMEHGSPAIKADIEGVEESYHRHGLRSVHIETGNFKHKY